MFANCKIVFTKSFILCMLQYTKKHPSGIITIIKSQKFHNMPREIYIIANEVYKDWENPQFSVTQWLSIMPDYIELNKNI